MASIVERTISSETDKRLSITNEQGGRTLNVGSTWSSIRIGMRWSINTAATSATIPSFYLGMSSGTTSLPNDTTPQHFLGVGTSTSLVLSSTHANGLYSSSATTNFPCWKIQSGSVSSSTTGTGSVASVVAFRSTVGWGMSLVEITKNSSTSFQVKGQRWFTLTSCTSALFDSAMDTGADVTNLRVGCDVAITVDEATYGALDSIALSWGHATIPMEISDLDFRILA